MQEVPKDIWGKISEEMSPSDLIKFCQSHPTPSAKRMCNSNDFWAKRLKKDFPDMVPYIKDLSKAKENYLRIFSIISKNVEETQEVLLEFFGPFRRFLHSEYYQELSSILFNLIVEYFSRLSRSEKETLWTETFINSMSYHFVLNRGDRQIERLFPGEDIRKFPGKDLFSDLDRMILVSAKELAKFLQIYQSGFRPLRTVKIP